ncbi:lipocalin family protein [Gordonia phthalatica]|uniref:lipocalin family protein n=1 Tax=Gordonia phthalatica TaxID=1136941 RepID=UPI003AAD97FF
MRRLDRDDAPRACAPRADAVRTRNVVETRRIDDVGAAWSDRPQRGRHHPPNCVIVALGRDYSWALVTDPARTSGFVLSRTPVLSSTQWKSVRGAGCRRSAGGTRPPGMTGVARHRSR